MFVLLATVSAPGPQPGDGEQELEDAKTMYREARFAEAAAKLQGIIIRLQHLDKRQAQLAGLTDAHLHLALSYVALNDPAAAKESLKAMLRLDPTRTLDTEVYAPKVIVLLEEARAELLREPAPAAADSTIGDAPGDTSEKAGGSKTLPILLGVGAAGAAGIAVATGGGGDSGSSLETGGATVTPTPTPIPTSTSDIVFLGSEPPPGGTVSFEGGELLLNLSVLYNGEEGQEGSGLSGMYNIYTVAGINSGGGACFAGSTGAFWLNLGEGVDVVAHLWRGQQPCELTPPYSIDFVTFCLHYHAPDETPCVLSKAIQVAYTVE